MSRKGRERKSIETIRAGLVSVSTLKPNVPGLMFNQDDDDGPTPTTHANTFSFVLGISRILPYTVKIPE